MGRTKDIPTSYWDMFMREGLYILPGEPESYVSRNERDRKEWGPGRSALRRGVITLESQHNEKPPFSGCLEVTIRFYFKHPTASFQSPRTYPGHLYSPSLETLYKFIQDISKPVLFDRVNCVVNLHLFKGYDSDPRTEIHIKEISK